MGGNDGNGNVVVISRRSTVSLVFGLLFCELLLASNPKNVVVADVAVAVTAGAEAATSAGRLELCDDSATVISLSLFHPPPPPAAAAAARPESCCPLIPRP